MSTIDTWSIGAPVPSGEVCCPRCKGPVETAAEGAHACPCGAREDGGLATDAALLIQARRVVAELTEENARLKAGGGTPHRG